MASKHPGTNFNAASGTSTAGSPFGPDVEQPLEVRNRTTPTNPFIKADERTPLKVASEVLSKGASSETKVDEPTLLGSPVRWVRKLTDTYSWRLLAMVVCTNHLLKGFVAGGGDEGLVGKPIEFIFGAMGLSASRLQMLKAAAIAPWALKPVIALLSDAVPIYGYKKMPYVVLFTLFALLGALLLGLGIATTVPVIVASLFLIFLQVSSVDLLVEAKQSEEVKQKAKHGPEFFTFTWLGINCGQVLGVCLVGALIHYAGPRLPYLIAFPFMALVLWPTLSNYLGERPIPYEDHNSYLPLVCKHPILCALTLLIGFLIVNLIIGTFFLSEVELLVLSLVFASLVMAGFLIFIRQEITGPVVFYFMLGLFSFNIDGALFYFYTDTPEQYPEGPHFSAWFYTSALGATVFLGIMVGFISGTELFKNWSYRGILKVTVMLRAITQLALVPLLCRWNLSMGIPDHLWVLVVTGFDTMVFAWRWIPKQVMGAHLTPRGVEATMLGLNAGTFNMAMILSSYCGGYLLHRFGVRPAGAPGDGEMFQHLWMVQVVAALAPCTLLFIMPALIPTKLQTEPLLVERPDSATHNSVFENIRARRS
jgi:MFS family permease